jgi:hypothetical protein
VSKRKLGLSLRPIARLAQDEKPGCTSGDTGGGGGLGQGKVALTSLIEETKKAPGVPGLRVVLYRRSSLEGRSDTISKHKSGKAGDRISAPTRRIRHNVRGPGESQRILAMRKYEITARQRPSASVPRSSRKHSLRRPPDREMVGSPRRRPSKRNAERRRALELLSASPDGCTEAIILAHGFTTDFLVDLIRAGLATAQTERAVAGGRSMQVTRIRITGAGRRALAELRWP